MATPAHPGITLVFQYRCLKVKTNHKLIEFDVFNHTTIEVTERENVTQYISTLLTYYTSYDDC